MIKSIIIIILFFICSFDSFSQGLINNLDKLDSLCHKASRNLVLSMQSYKVDTLYYNLSDIPAKWLFEQYLLKYRNEFSMALLSDKGKLPELSITLKNINVQYQIYPEDSDSLYRIINVEIVASFTDKNKRVVSLPEIKESFKEAISRDNIDYVENTPYTFAKSKVPEKPKSFWKEIIEPVAIITTGALTVFLFFSVRSN